jgi:hypothetical protein
MKITTTQTTTQTTEVEISLPAFTKVKSTYNTSYYYVKSEDKTTRIDIYSHGIKTFSHIDNYKNAFSDNFEFISEEEFIKMYQLLVNEVRIELNQIKLDLAQLQLDAKAEQERAEYFEYQDKERAEREEYLSQFEDEDY